MKSKVEQSFAVSVHHNETPILVPLFLQKAQKLAAGDQG